MNTYRLVNFRTINEKLLAKRYTDYKASKARSSHRYKLVARRNLENEPLYMELYRSGSTALIERVDVKRDEVLRYYKGKPVDKTRLSYMIGEYSIQQLLKEEPYDE